MPSNIFSGNVFESQGSDTLNDRTDGHCNPTVTGNQGFSASQSDAFRRTLPYLVILSGRDRGKRFGLEKQINQFGRSQNADIAIMDPKISRSHGRLIVFPNKVLIEDTHSTNGTFVDGVRIDKTSLDSRSRIRIGSTVMKIDYKDINEVHFENALYEAAHTDSLTGLPNRRAFMARAEYEITLCRESNLDIAIAMCDADHFKRINDTYGHPAGDYVLQEFARLTKEIVRFEDQVARYGGEEFIILLRGLDAETAIACCNRIRTAIETHPFRFQEHAMKCTLSMGICSRRGKHIPKLEQLIQTADEALLKAKRSGRNRIEFG